MICKVNNLGPQKQSPVEILFLYPSFTASDLTAFNISYHSGVSYILAYLREKGIHGLHFIQKEPIDLDSLVRKILQRGARVIGFTCFDINYPFVRIISQRLKECSPKTVILAGGPTATFSDGLIMQNNPAIDICVRGEGEITTYELLTRLERGRELKDIPGITYRLGAGIFRNPDRPLITSGIKGEELDIIPSPYLSGVNPPGEECGVITSRGCIFKCVYCNFSAMSRWTVRYHSVERVVSELKKICLDLKNKNKTGITVNINDDAFSLNPARAKQLCRRIIEEKINLNLWCETRADRVDRELLTLMYRSGIRSVSFGLESAVPRVLKTIKKVRDSSCNERGLGPEKRFIEKIKENVEFAHGIGIHVVVSVILGLPGATIEDDRYTMGFVDKLKIDAYQHNYLNVFAGTELFKTFKRYGLEVRPSANVFPFHTRLAIDSFGIPLNRNSLEHVVIKNKLARITEPLKGDYKNLKGQGGYPDLFFKNSPLDAGVLEWLKGNVSLYPLMLFCGNYTGDDSMRRGLEEVVYHAYPAPLGRAYLLEPFNGGGAGKFDLKAGRYRLIVAARGLKSPGVIIDKNITEFFSLDYIPFGEYLKNNFNASESDNSNWNKEIFFTLSTLRDIERLSRLFPASGKITLDPDKVKFDCNFVDGCRWSSSDCPIKGFSRCIVEADGTVRGCFNGAKIAEVGEPRKKITGNLKLLWDRTRQERGCDRCDARESCAKCIFPYPFDAKEYCAIRRGGSSGIKMKGISKAFKFFELIRKIRSASRNFHSECNTDKITGSISDEGLSILDIGRRRYFYHERIGELRCMDL